MTFLWLVPASYLLGAVPFGLLVGRWTRQIDVREFGSGNTGVTNLLRAAGLGPALAALALDAGKGILVVALARVIDPSPPLEVAVALAVLAGHNWSIFMRFKGGKGTATGVGALCALSPLVGVAVLSLCLPIIAVSKYVSLGAIIGAVIALAFMALIATLAPTLPMGVSSLTYLLYPAIGAPMVLFKHRGNMGRLLKRQERKLGESEAKGASAETGG